MARGNRMQHSAWPLVGRERELALIDAAYAGAGGIVLVGEAGVGKTRLARQALVRPAAAGAPAAWAAASRSAAALPLGALAHLLLSGERSAAGPRERPAAGPPDATAGPLDALELLVARFSRRGGPQPVLGVDDAHLLDDASAALLYQLAAGGHAFVVVTARAEEPVPDAVTALWTDDVASRLDIPPLPAGDMAALLVAALDGRIDAASGLSLRHRCRGNPLLLREVLRAGRETGTLRRAGGVWRWTGEDYVTLRLTDVVTERLGALEPDLRGLAELLAWAEPLPLPLLESLTSHATVVAAERRRLIGVHRSGARLVASLAYPVYADVIRARTPRSRDREIWRSLAGALAATPMRRRDDVLLAAQWRQRAGLLIPPDMALAAAHRAVDRLDLDAAERFARLATGAPAALLLTEVLLDAGRYADADAALAAAPEGTHPDALAAASECTQTAAAPAAAAECTHPDAALPAAPDDVDLRRRWAVARRRVAYWNRRRRDADPPGPASADTSPGVGLDRYDDAARSWSLVLDGNTIEASRVSGAVLAAPSGVPVNASGWAAAAAVLSAGLLGRHEQAMAALRTGLAVADRHPDRHPWAGLQVAGAGCLALLATGRLREAADLADQRHRAAVDTLSDAGLGAAPLVGAWAALRGAVARAQGRAAYAVAELGEAAVLLDGRPTLLLAAAYLAELAAAHALTGDLGAAAARLAEAERRESPGPLFEAWVKRARACVTAAGGDLTLAVDQALHAGALARATQQPTIEALALFDAARFGGASRAETRLAVLADELEGPAVPAMAAVAAALRSNRAGAALDRAAATLAGLGQSLYAAEAATAAHLQHLRSGRRALAQASLARAAILVRDCEGARTPLLGPHGLYTVLTSREMQVAALAAAGHSAPTIASRLGLSARTVNNYLGRAYDKLGVRGRTQLADVLTDLAATPRHLSA
ncbi:MAG TPA: LuxR family transcriptional regulator [Pilimelia sp.]|nr:LuxR family transcriptional regulator [Pilimelia sp.]